MDKIILNKSKTYLLPLLSEFVDFDAKFYTNIVNSYMFEDTGKYKDCIFLLHDFNFREPEFTHYENQLINNDLFVDLVDIDNKVLYIFKYPKDYMEEYELFKEGKYSHFGGDAKELILTYFTNLYKNNINAVEFLLKIKHILFKDEKLKRKMERDLKVTLSPEAELSDKMEISNETFKLSEVIQLEKKG
ncbi:MAG: hypothetical protein KUG81_08700 [Gammaproteobacteria bacterium]|nr:hypothetical protein [Gammaproteobacteria bacterium]